MTERIDDLIASSYDVACRHGFHDVETSIEHQMMLVIGELGEAVEADRKGKRANVTKFKDSISQEVAKGFYKEYGEVWKFLFEENIKDTVEDELADVCIRLFDLCGCFGVRILQPNESMLDDWRNSFGGESFTERAYDVVRLLCCCGSSVSNQQLSVNIGSALWYIQYWCDAMQIDLDWHIDMKQRYNDGRERLHGKKY